MSNLEIFPFLGLSLISSPINNTLSTNASFPTEQVDFSSKAPLRQMNYLSANAPQYLPMGVYVGELQEKWLFPSDHLPIGMSLQDLHIVSWNILDAEYIGWVLEKNSQGLKRSMIGDEHIYIDRTKLTLRDRHVAGLILEMIFHSTHPRSLLCLQECSKTFLKELGSCLPSHFAIVSNYGEAVIYDKSKWELLETNNVVGVFADSPKRTIQDLLFLNIQGEKIRLINAHLPGDLDKPARYEFSNYLARTFDPATTTLAMGDMNFNELQMTDALQRAFLTALPFAIYSPYCTNIEPYTYISKAIDHFFVYSPNQAISINEPEEVLPNLSAMTKLLNGP